MYIYIACHLTDTNATPNLHTSAYVSIRQHTSAYVSIRQHVTSPTPTPHRTSFPLSSHL